MKKCILLSIMFGVTNIPEPIITLHTNKIPLGKRMSFRTLSGEEVTTSDEGWEIGVCLEL